MSPGRSVGPRLISCDRLRQTCYRRQKVSSATRLDSGVWGDSFVPLQRRAVTGQSVASHACPASSAPKSPGWLRYSLSRAASLAPTYCPHQCSGGLRDRPAVAATTPPGHLAQQCATIAADPDQRRPCR